MFERYTERARRVVFFARYEASQFGSKTIEAEHLLLGLLREDKNVANRFLPNQSLEHIREEVSARLPVREKVATSIDLPLSDECRRILRFASEESEKFGHKHISTEHLLLGILMEENSTAAKILTERGLKLNFVRELISRSPAPEEPGVFSSLSSRLFPFFSAFKSPGLPEKGVVPNADTAMQIAEAVWLPMFDAETIASQMPLRAELRFNVWIVTGSKEPESALFAFILQADGRILSVGRGSAG